MSPTTAVCICVDDFGLTEGINEAALHLAGMQRVHAISSLVGGPAWPAWGRVLQRLRAGGVDIGLHLDLTEYPLLPGSRRGLGQWLAASHFRCIDPVPLGAEIRAQLDTFERALGHGPDFVDGHRHVHQLPVVRSALCAELQRRGPAYRPWLRSTRRAQGGVAAPARAAAHTAARAAAGTAAGTAALAPNGAWREALKPWLIEQLGARGLASLAAAHGHGQNNHLLGVYDFDGGARQYLRMLTGWLGNAAEGDLLMCHPARRLDSGDPLAAARRAEFGVLAGARFGALLHQSSLQLRPMSAILADAASPKDQSDQPGTEARITAPPTPASAQETPPGPPARAPPARCAG